MKADREEFLKEPVSDVKVTKSMSITDLIEAYNKIHGFMAGHLVRAIEILRKCLQDSDLRVISFTANLVATGLRGIFTQLIEKGVFNLVVTTCGTIDHDIARSFGGTYYKGYFEADDRMLRDLEIHRLGNVFIPVENYGPLIEKVVYSTLDELDRNKEWAIYEILDEIGKRTNDENSILRAAHLHGVPIIVPGYLDGAFGTALFTYTQIHKDLHVNPFKDEEVMAEKFFHSKKATALIIGGGISKHHTIWWAQFREGLDCAVYLTTAVEYDGSLSGAHPREAISWGKIRPEANHVVVYGDATILLPILTAAIIE
ncbi:deoxyhypusine synthase [Pyrofollis japonicus]|nr:deoxyhypusine synthase [Pyrofollis japonicus]